MFEGIVGSSYDGDIAIDDIFIDQDKACRPAGACSFEDSLCLWSYDKSSDFEFDRITAQQLQTVTGLQSAIVADTTTNTKYGHFLWTGSGLSNQTTRLISETFFANNYNTGASCFSFKYFINGIEPGSLNVYRKYYKGDKILHFSVNSSSGDQWNQALVSLPSADYNFELLIEVSQHKISFYKYFSSFEHKLYRKQCSKIFI